MLPLPAFTYHEPKTLEEACALLSADSGSAMVLAGGTDLLVKMKQGLVRPTSLVSLKAVPGLRNIECVAGEYLSIGALAGLNEAIASQAVGETFGVLIQAVRATAFEQVRNRATVGGNLCNASPAADAAAALLALDGRARIAGPAGEREVPLEEFFAGPGRTVLRRGEILTGIRVPIPPPHCAGSYVKLAPRQNDLATVSVAAVITMDAEGKAFEDARVVLGAVAPTVVRSREAERALKGRMIDEGVIEAAARAASESARPISDVRASAQYRTEMVRLLAGRAIAQAVESARARLHSSGGEGRG